MAISCIPFLLYQIVPFLTIVTVESHFPNYLQGWYLPPHPQTGHLIGFGQMEWCRLLLPMVLYLQQIADGTVTHPLKRTDKHRVEPNVTSMRDVI